jgi:hypothetical protein
MSRGLEKRIRALEADLREEKVERIRGEAEAIHRFKLLLQIFGELVGKTFEAEPEP